MSTVTETKNSILDPSFHKKIALCRVLLGCGIFLYSLFFANLKSYAEAPRFAGFNLSWIIESPSFLIGLYIFGLVSILLFTMGFKTLFTGFLTLLFHCLFHRKAEVSFGWEALIDPFLLLILCSSLNLKKSQWPLRILKFNVCVIYAYVAWTQTMQAPWLDRNMVQQYLRFSPFAQIYTAYDGFIPLLQIVGGLAWIAQLLAPLLLWQKSLGKYLAVLLIALHGLLEIFMPTAYCNYVMVIALLSFLPEEWFTFNRVYWSGQLPNLKIAWRNFSFFFLGLVMLLTMFDRNITQQFEILAKIDNPPLEKIYKITTSPFVEVGNLILFNSIWKMYSPTWRKVVWIEWYYKKADQSVELWPQDNFSPDYRMHRRTWLQALWTDFKKEKVFVGMLSGPTEKAAYGQYLCREILTQTGKKPVSVHPEVNSFAIRGPQEKWSIEDQASERKDIGNEIPCD